MTDYVSSLDEYYDAHNVSAEIQPRQLKPGQIPFEVPNLPGADARDGTECTRPLTELGKSYN